MSFQKGSTLQTFHEVVQKYINVTDRTSLVPDCILLKREYYSFTEADINTHLLQKAMSSICLI